MMTDEELKATDTKEDKVKFKKQDNKTETPVSDKPDNSAKPDVLPKGTKKQPATLKYRVILARTINQ
ncbi:MAG: hypothetical protein LBS34_00300 [Rickettsiales bacterium]|jgi:hypothetical protein|nr:hypothetical protein [Rickettsiales bacterium]